MSRIVKIFLLLLIGSTAFGQYQPWQTMPFNYRMKRVKADSGLIAPRLTSLNSGVSTVDSVGAIFYYNTDNSLYVKTTTGAKALAFGSISTPTLAQVTTAGNTTTNTITAGGLVLTGSFSPQLSVVTSGNTLSNAYTTAIANTADATCTVTLPTGGTHNGRMYFIKRSSQANTLTVNTGGSDVFDDGTNTMLVSNAIIVQYQGDTWWILAKY